MGRPRDVLWSGAAIREVGILRSVTLMQPLLKWARKKHPEPIRLLVGNTTPGEGTPLVGRLDERGDLYICLESELEANQ